MSYKETDVVMGNAREFVIKIKLVLSELDQELVRVINEKIKGLKRVTAR